ncbi:MAG: exo-beta-N-acetylmuramidase NamZ domain-containing protein [Bacteroidota bacterium]
MSKVKQSIVLIMLLLAGLFQANGQVKTGIEVLRENSFAPLVGKRVGLITNPTGVDSRLKSTIDILAEAEQVELVALYGPEHGVRGDYPAGEYVENQNDPRTGVPMFSLYGKTRKPTAEMLQGVDVLVYDIQDIGSRSYTYISTLGLAMEAAAEQGIEFMVLDRPNPLGGNKFEGPVVREGFFSFVSQFPIPYVHGFTVGELARFLNGEQLLANGIQAELTVIQMEGWNRSMSFDDTGLPWVMSSPHIPHSHSAYFYPVSGIMGELISAYIGIGYTLPFQVFGAEWISNAELFADRMNKLQIPGVVFRPIHFRPFYTDMKGSRMQGVQAHIFDLEAMPLSLIQFYVMQEMYAMHPEYNLFEMAPTRLRMFDQVAGTDEVRKTFQQRLRVEDIQDIWTRDIPAFLEKAKPWFIY